MITPIKDTRIPVEAFVQTFDLFYRPRCSHRESKKTEKGEGMQEDKKKTERGG